MELHWMSASELAAAIARREVSSREVLDHLVDRIETLDAPVNSVVQWDLERARAEAEAADAATAANRDVGALHGVPMTIKDSFPTTGCVTTSGSPDLATYVPDEDAWPVARLREAGAIPFAKTNLPLFADDIQSFNEVYGTTNNPHDPSRTPGGSSGGSAAALAMGFTPLELGSDIGGSIRVPAHYCGVAGHKPSYGIVPGHGQIPGMPGTLTQADLAVVGPLARTAADLELALDVLAGPDRWSSPAWRLELPAARASSLAEFRIAAWIDDDACPIESDTRRALEETFVAIEAAGGRVDTDARPAFTLDKAFDVYRALLFAALSGGTPMEQLDAFAADESDTALGRIRRESAVRHRGWLSANERRLQLRERWAEFFVDVDVILLPVHPRAAFEHDHSMPQFARRLPIGDAEHDYLDLWRWIAPAGVGALPATVVPVGLDADGLPIGIQVVGPYLHDRTTIRLAGIISELMADRHHWPGPCPRPSLA